MKKSKHDPKPLMVERFQAEARAALAKRKVNCLSAFQRKPPFMAAFAFLDFKVMLSLRFRRSPVYEGYAAEHGQAHSPQGGAASSRL